MGNEALSEQLITYTHVYTVIAQLLAPNIAEFIVKSALPKSNW